MRPGGGSMSPVQHKGKEGESQEYSHAGDKTIPGASRGNGVWHLMLEARITPCDTRRLLLELQDILRLGERLQVMQIYGATAS